MTPSKPLRVRRLMFMVRPLHPDELVPRVVLNFWQLNWALECASLVEEDIGFWMEVSVKEVWVNAAE